MHWTRREALAVGTGSLLGLLGRADGPAPGTGPCLGVVIHSYMFRRAAEKGRGVDDPLTFLDYCRSLGAGGVQTALGVRDDAYAARMQELLTAHKLFLEGSIALPRERADLERFTAEV